jgi:hypothetical protein
MGEAAEGTTGRGRWDWDVRSCRNLFSALRINLAEDCIKFCRRVGEPGAVPRPLVVGFHEEADRARLLRSDTRGTVFENMEVCPDLTKKQRQEETGMQEEAVKRNMNLSDEDRAKKLGVRCGGAEGSKNIGEKAGREGNRQNEDAERTRTDGPQEHQRGGGACERERTRQGCGGNGSGLD